MKKLTVNIQLDESDDAAAIMQVVTELIDEVNDMGYAVLNASLNGTTVFGNGRFYISE